MKTLLISLAVLPLALTQLACGSSPADSGPVYSGPPPVSWTRVYGEVITQCADHHSGGTPAGKLDLGTQGNAYANLVGVIATGEACGAAALDGGTPALRVKPRSSGASLLYTKLTGSAACGTQMPQQGQSLPAAQIALVKSWIDEGAPND